MLDNLGYSSLILHQHSTCSSFYKLVAMELVKLFYDIFILCYNQKFIVPFAIWMTLLPLYNFVTAFTDRSYNCFILVLLCCLQCLPVKKNPSWQGMWLGTFSESAATTGESRDGKEIQGPKAKGLLVLVCPFPGL